MPGLQIQTPLPDQASRPIGTPYDSNRVTPEEMGAGVGTGIQQVASGVAQVATVALEQANVAKAQEIEARLVRTSDDLKFDSALDDNGQPRGFMYQRGEAAMAALKPTQDRWQKEVDGALAEATPAQRRLLQGRVLALSNHFNTSLQEHQAQQVEVVKAQAYKSRHDAGIDAATNAWNDPTARESAIRSLQAWDVLESRRLGESPEVAAERWRNTQKDAALAVLHRQLSKMRGDGAQAFMDSPLLPLRADQRATLADLPADQQAEALGRAAPTVRDLLGSSGADVQHQIEQVRLTQTAVAETRRLIPDVLKPSGEVDFDKLNERLDAMPTDTPQESALKQHVQSLAEHQAVTLHKAWQQKADALHTQILSQATITDESNGQGRIDVNLVPPQMLNDFKTLDPKGYERLQKRSLEDSRLVRRADTIEERRAQRDQEKATHNEWFLKFLDPAGRRELAATPPERFDRLRVEMNAGEFGQLKAMHNKLLAGQEKEPPEMAVVREASDAIGLQQGTPLYRQPPAVQEKLSQLVQSVSGDPEYKAWLLDHPGKTPPRSVIAPIVARKKVQVPQPGTGILGTSLLQDKPMQFELDAQARAAGAGGAAAPAKAITGYRYSKDRKQRIPVYSDGSQGQPETVP